MHIVTRNLIIANVAVYILGLGFGDKLISLFALWPIGHFYVADLHTTVGFNIWQIITYAFLHSSFTHIALNMFALYIFGTDVEDRLGTKYYLFLYLASVISAGLVQLIIVTLLSHSSVYPTLGASGGIFGILLAYGMLFPSNKVFLLFPPIVLPAIAFVIIYGLIELVSGILGAEAGVAHFAHLGGMLGGFIVIKYWQNHIQKYSNYTH